MFSMFAWGNATFACGVRSARKRSFEACSETDVGRGLLAPEPRPLPPLVLTPRKHPMQMEPPTWSSDLHGRYFARNWTIPDAMLATVVVTTAMLLSDSCRSLTHFISVLRKQFAANDTFLREANGYKWVLTLRNSRQYNEKQLMFAPFYSRLSRRCYDVM